MSDLSLANATISKSGGLPYAVAAIHEGFCPCCTSKLTVAPASVTERIEDTYPSPPSAQGFCAPCALFWSAGAHPPAIAANLHHADWFSIDDVFDGMLRRMTYNPGPDNREDDWDDDDEGWV